MSNVFATQQKITNAFLLLLKNELVMGKLVTTKFDKEYSNETVAVGDTVKVRRPPEFTVRDGATMSAQDAKVGTVDVTIDKQKGVDVSFTSKELTLDVDELLKNQMLKAKAAVLAQQIDSDLIGETLEFPQWVGTPGQLINSASDFFVGVQRAMELSIPMDDLHGILSPADHFALAGTFTSLSASDATVKLAIEKAKLPMVGGVQPYVSQNVVNLTVGTRAASGASLVNGASQNVTYDSVRTTFSQTLNVDGLTSGHTIKRGEVFTIAGVNAVNPRSKSDLGYLQKFVVLADATANGSGQAALTIANPIITSGAYQTVSAAPADDAAIIWMGTASTAYLQNSIFHRGSIALVGAKLEEPKSGIYAYASDPDTGLSIRTWSQSDITNDAHATRVDVLYGVSNLDRRLGLRLSGSA
ncbi:MAG: hypothetical protein HY865_22580 [Chloroflexi bacterium]|nr:hypothetical protein [Chloroflexota bacterium]